MNSLPLQPYDIFMLAVIVLTTIFGAWKGMAWQIASLASLVVSSLVAMHFGGPLAPYFSQREPWNRFLAMLVLYVLTSLIIWLGFRVIAGMIDRVHLREFDRQIGAFFGLAKGVLLCLVITFFAVTLSEAARQTVLRARSGYYIARFIQRANPVMPEEVRSLLGKYIDELDRKLDPATPPDQPAKPPAEIPLGTPSETPLSAGRGVPSSAVRGDESTTASWVAGFAVGRVRAMGRKPEIFGVSGTSDRT
jgi:membrane protein required for colicin V production